MKRFAAFCCAIAALSAPDSQAATQVDSILAYTGATEAKFTFCRFRWADSSTGNRIVSGPTTSTNWQLLGYDTKDNALRYYDAPSLDHQAGKIDRSGNWVVWPDYTAKKTWIRDFDAKTPARVLIDGTVSGNTFWFFQNFGYNASTGVEYLYCTNNYTTDTWAGDQYVYKIPFSFTDGTVNLSARVAINFGPQPDGGTAALGISSISADGNMIACSFPWPTDFLFNVTTSSLIDRHGDGSFGCQPNVAPDNSYRFYHCLDDHQGILIYYELNLTSNYVHLSLDTNLYGLPADYFTNSKYGVWDFGEPRWSNHPRLLSLTAPMGSENTGHGYSTFPTNASAVDPFMLQTLHLTKFSSDFRHQLGDRRICYDPTVQCRRIETWLSNGITTTNQTPGAVPEGKGPVGGAVGVIGETDRSNLSSGNGILRNGDYILFSPAGASSASVRIADMSGRIIRRAFGTNPVAVSTQGLSTGAYVIMATSGNKTVSQLLAIARK